MRDLVPCCAGVAIALFIATANQVSAGEQSPTDLAAQLRGLNGKVLAEDAGHARMLANDAKARLQAANVRENRDWEQLQDRAGWEKFRDARIQALRVSLGAMPPVPRKLKWHVTGTLEGDGYRIENLVFESRPGLVVTGNLYLPSQPVPRMPCIVIVHSHHNPATQGELQDMGMTWARSGCLVFVPELLGHGERRQHPFRSASDYQQTFRVSRQDYHFRYVTGLQLNLLGDSLMGWNVWDLMRGIDILLARPDVDRERLIVLGAVAGGGDPAGVLAALDPRVQAVVPFNFGGVQPDYAVPADPARDFYYFGVPYWESTRCLRLGARDGFAHWLIVGSVAPRRLIYAHEFAWDRERDPAWPRLQRIFNWYDAPMHLASAAGQGTLKGTPPESSHCNNIGALHRSRIYPALKQWFNMPIPEEYSKRRTPEELVRLEPQIAKEVKPRPAYELMAELADRYTAGVRGRLAKLAADERRGEIRHGWKLALGDIEPASAPKVQGHEKKPLGNVQVERVTLEVEPGIVVPLLLLLPARQPGTRLPFVLGLAQEGKEAFLKHRSEAIAELLARNTAVALVDVRGTGETRPGDGPGRHNSVRTSRSTMEWLLGQTLVGARLRDARSVLQYLRTRSDLDPRRAGLWGDSVAPVNAKDRNTAVPLDVDPFPNLAEPLGGLLALLGALFDDDVQAVAVQGGLVGYRSVLESPFCYVPHDALIPGALRVGDLCDLTGVLAPRPVRLARLVDGLNRAVPATALAATFAPARSAYDAQKAGGQLRLEDAPLPGRALGRWLAEQLRAP